MPGLFHSPITTLQDVDALIARRAPENIHLEYKETWWESPTHSKRTKSAPSFLVAEFAKDVAAMMNQQGGDIVVGIVEDDSCASGYRDPDNGGQTLEQGPRGSLAAPTQIEKFRQALFEMLEPREAANHVSFRHLTSAHSDASAWVITIAPFRHSVVAVRCSPNPESYPQPRQKVAHLFPVRTDEGTRYMELGEYARRTNQRVRSAELEIRRLLSYRDTGGANAYAAFQITSSVVVEKVPHRMPLLFNQLAGHAGLVVGLEDDVLVLNAYRMMDEAYLQRSVMASKIVMLKAIQSPNTVEREITTGVLKQRDEFKWGKHQEHWGDRSKLYIPLSLIKHAWLQRTVSHIRKYPWETNPPDFASLSGSVLPRALPVLHLDLDATIVYSNDWWALET